MFQIEDVKIFFSLSNYNKIKNAITSKTVLMVYNLKNDFDFNFGSHNQGNLERPWF